VYDSDRSHFKPYKGAADREQKQNLIMDHLEKSLANISRRDMESITRPLQQDSKRDDKQSLFIRAAISGDKNKMELYINKINHYFNQRHVMMKVAENMLMQG